MGPLLPCNLYVGIVGTHTACISYYERTRRIQGCISPLPSCPTQCDTISCRNINVLLIARFWGWGNKVIENFRCLPKDTSVKRERVVLDCNFIETQRAHTGWRMWIRSIGFCEHVNEPYDTIKAENPMANRQWFINFVFRRMASCR
jgi:hypothetical protein